MFPNDDLSTYLVGRFLRVKRNTMDDFLLKRMELISIGSWDPENEWIDPNLIAIDKAPKFPTTAPV